MFRPTKMILTGLAVCMVTVLTACNLGQAAEPTPTAFDMNILQTNVAATIAAQQTAEAPTITPTFTVTLLPSDTPAGAAVTETSGVPVETAALATPTITPTASETLFGTTAIPSLTPTFTPIVVVSNPTNSGPLCKDSAFAGDITIPDKTVMEPWEKFEKVWGVTNTGTCRWDEGFFFAAISGPPSMGTHLGKRGFKTPERFVEPGQTVAISIDMYAPGEPGEYVAHWHMFDDNGEPFGGDFTVVIIVEK